MTTEQEARKQIDRRVHGLKVRLGQARAREKLAETLDEKIALYARAKEVERDLHALQRRYWQEVGKLEAQLYADTYPEF